MMKITRRPYAGEEDYWRLRHFLRDVFMLNDRREHSWHVARLDYWRWHFILNCHVCESIEKATTLWETGDGTIAAMLNPIGSGEIRMHVHPLIRTPELEDDMLACAEQHHANPNDDGKRRLYLPVDSDDQLRQAVLLQRGFVKLTGTSNKWRRDLESPVPEPHAAPGYTIRSMGDLDEHPARSWASWRAFHADEPDGHYDGDWSWVRNVQTAPLYRRDLDIVAVTPRRDVAAFATIYYDDSTRSAVCVLVGTAAEHQRRGLARAVLLEGFKRLQWMGCTRVFATGYEPPADALYRSVMHRCDVWETWTKESQIVSSP